LHHGVQILNLTQQTCAAGFTTPGLVAGCPLANVACICSNSTFISSISCCLVAHCDQADQVQAIGFADQLCSNYGVTVPTAVICLTGSSTATASTSTGSSTTTARTSTSASSNLTMTNTAFTTTKASTITSTASTTSTKVSSSASTVSTGGAAQNRAGVGVGFAGGLLAALAFLG
jgi:hypothetical protein